MDTIEDEMGGVYLQAICAGESAESAETRAVSYYLHQCFRADIWQTSEAMENADPTPDARLTVTMAV